MTTKFPAQTKLLTTFAFLILSTLSLTSASHATLYSFENNNPHHVSRGTGTLESVKGTYDDVNEQFTWDSVFQAENGNLPDFLYLVVTDGDNPKRYEAEFAIIYADLSNQRINTYVYNEEGKLSYLKPNTHIETINNGIQLARTGDELRVSLVIDTDFTNNQFDPTVADVDQDDWRGIRFGDKIGVWYHSTDFVQYNANGQIVSFDKGVSGYYDASFVDTTSDAPNAVPEPATMTLMAMGAGALGLYRKRKK